MLKFSSKYYYRVWEGTRSHELPPTESTSYLKCKRNIFIFFWEVPIGGSPLDSFSIFCNNLAVVIKPHTDTSFPKTISFIDQSSEFVFSSRSFQLIRNQSGKIILISQTDCKQPVYTLKLFIYREGGVDIIDIGTATAYI